MGAATFYPSPLDAWAWGLFLLKTIVPGLLLIPIAYVSENSIAEKNLELET